MYKNLIDKSESVEKGYFYCCTHIIDYSSISSRALFAKEITKSFFYVVERLFFTSSRDVFSGESF